MLLKVKQVRKKNYILNLSKHIDIQAITVYEGSTFSFQRLQKGQAVKVIISSWIPDEQPCLQVLLHGCKAQGNCSFHSF